MEAERTIREVRPVIKDLYLNPFNVAFYLVTTLVLGLGIALFLAKVLGRKTTSFTLTTERIVLRSGVFSKNVDDVELYRVQDTKVHQGPFDRMMGIGSVVVNNDDLTGAFTIDKVVDPVGLREEIRKATEELKRARSVRVITS